MLRKYIENYLKENTNRSSKSTLIKLLISDNQKFNEINNFIDFGTFKQKLYHYLSDDKNIVICLICSNQVNWNEKDFCYRETCSPKCSGKLNLYRKYTSIKEYPILNSKDDYYRYFCSSKIKITESSVSKHYPELLQNLSNINFVNNFNQKVYCYLKNIDKIPTCLHCKISNVYFDTFSKGFHKYCSIKCSSNSEIKKNTIKDTVNEKYGVDNIGEVTRDKALETMIDKYGSHISKTDQYKEKFKKTSLENYGFDHPFKNKIIRDKIKNTNIKTYGFENPMKNKNISEKGLLTKKDKGLIFKWSDEELKLYENYRRKVTYLSEKSYQEHISELNPEGYKRGHVTYHLDHIYPVILGFVNKVEAELISDYRNLQILTHIENRVKHDKTEMTLDDFYKNLE